MSKEVFINKTKNAKSVFLNRLLIIASTLCLLSGVIIPSIATAAPNTPPPATTVLGQGGFTTNMDNYRQVNGHNFQSVEGLAVDTINHRLFVSDNGEYANRILVFNLNSSNQLVDTEADYVIGQTSLTANSADCDNADPTASNLCEPEGMAVDEDNNRLFVADSDYNRVLVYNLDNLATGMSASYVIGQSSFTEGYENGILGNTSDSGFNNPTYVTYDNAYNRLFVSDIYNNRVLAFDVSPGTISNGMSASKVLGQTSFTSNCSDACSSTSASGLMIPSGLDYDTASGYLAVADSGNSRVLIYNLDDNFNNGEAAVAVVGQADFTSNNANGPSGSVANNVLSEPASLRFASNKLFISDESNNRVVILNSSGSGLAGISTNANFDYVLGQADFTHGDDNQGGATPTAGSLKYQDDIQYIPGTNTLVVADDSNDRVVFYDVSTITDGEDAVMQIGQSDFTTAKDLGAGTPNSIGFNDPRDIAIDNDNNRLFVADYGNMRVLVYDTDDSGVPLDNTAEFAIGQVNLSTDSDCQDISASDLCEPSSVEYDSINDRLFVADKYNNRVLVYNVAPGTVSNGMSASFVLGQDDMVSDDSNKGSSVSASGLYSPKGLAYSSSQQMLYVSDTDNNRVLGFNVAPGTIANGMDATRVIGQADFTNVVYGTSISTVSSPRGLAIDKVRSRLYVADAYNNRVVAFNIGSGFTNGEDVTVLIGQTAWDENNCNGHDGVLDANVFCSPVSVAIDPIANKLYVSENDNSRVLRFALADTYSAGTMAEQVYGQTATDSDSCNGGDDLPSSTTICEPEGIEVNQETGQLWVVDDDNQRVLGYGALRSGSGESETPEDPSSDSDGIPDSVENSSPNSGDANNDGTPDSTQANVASYVNPVTNSYVVLQTSSECSITTT
ncbi:NHL repeat-containing protein, partial [Candidatus Saccharibacteria bacterium]|nr:NHL repeat-containing protein [Candidatus Saccharibacteria bacterium]